MQLGAKLVAHQKIAFAAEAAKTVAAANSSNSPGSALGKIMDDPAMRELMKQQQVAMLKTQYGPLLKSLNLGPEASAKFMQLLSDDASWRMDLGIAAMKGDVDAATAKQTDKAAKTELTNQLQDLLGTDGYTQYEQYKTEVPARTMVKAINSQMGDNAMNNDQSARLLALMKAEPKSSELDQFDTAAETDQYLQREAEHNQHVYAQAADFLAPEQLARLGAFQTNMLNMAKMGMSMKQKFSAKTGP